MKNAFCFKVVFLFEYHTIENSSLLVIVAVPLGRRLDMNLSMQAGVNSTIV